MSEWVERPLARLVSFKKGKKVETSELPLEGYLPYLGASSLTGGDDGHASPDGGVFCTDADALMLWDGERSGLVGPGKPGVLSSTVMRLRPEGEMTGRYLVHCLQDRFAWIQARRTGTGVPHVPKDLGRILNLRFPKSDAMQSKICDVLDAVDTQIEATEALIAKQERVRAGLMQDLFTRGVGENGQIRPPHEQTPQLYHRTALGWLPLQWEVNSISQAGLHIEDGDRGVHYPSAGELSDSGYCLFLSAANVTKDGFQFHKNQFVSEEKDALLRAGKLIRGDIVITTRGTVGQFAYYDGSVPYENVRINSGMLILRNSNPKIETRYLLLALDEQWFRRELTSKGSGSAQPQLPIKDFRNFRLPIPDEAEQAKIVECVDRFHVRAKAEKANLEKLRRQKSGIIQELLTGRVSVSSLLKGQMPEGLAA